MSEHLPECDRNRGSLICDCRKLRACEQRSYTLGIEVGKHDGWLAGHAAGVQAAREVVAAEAKARHVDGPTMFLTLPQALAAIDALTDAPHVDPCDCDKCRGKA